MASFRRGEVFLVNFDPTVGSEAKKMRPVVIVSNDINNAYSPIVSISPITSKCKAHLFIRGGNPFKYRRSQQKIESDGKPDEGGR